LHVRQEEKEQRRQAYASYDQAKGKQVLKTHAGYFP